MSATKAIAIGDKPERGTAFLAHDGTQCSVERVFGPCEMPGCFGVHLAICTAPAGHERGDVPHVANALDFGVIAIWTDSGDGVYGIWDDSAYAYLNAGATL